MATGHEAMMSNIGSETSCKMRKAEKSPEKEKTRTQSPEHKYLCSGLWVLVFSFSGLFSAFLILQLVSLPMLDIMASWPVAICTNVGKGEFTDPSGSGDCSFYPLNVSFMRI